MRIVELERELDEITKRAIMTTSSAAKSARYMAKEAMAEEASSADSYKKTRKVMVESSKKMAKA